MPSNLLPSLAHALSGSTGTAVATVTTYPLDLVNTRLKVQRQLASSTNKKTQTYTGILDAFEKIYATEGGITAFFAGLKADVAKSVVDSFLFFLFYNWFRSRRVAGDGRRRHLNAVEELAIGAVAGACARFFTTPVSNVVTRRQTAHLMTGEREETAGEKGLWEVLREIRQEKGFAGLWAGYSASLVLTLNPSVTFFLQQNLTKRLGRVAGEEEEEGGDGAGLTFLLAAVSKAFATALTYPFQIARARVQVGTGPEEEEEKGLYDKPGRKVGSLPKETIFGTVRRIQRDEGTRALYDGLQGELLKAFFSHGVTMVSKDVVHKLLLRLYWGILGWLMRHPETLARINNGVIEVKMWTNPKRVGEEGRRLWREGIEAKEAARAALSSGEIAVKEAISSGGNIVRDAASSPALKETLNKGGEVVRGAVSSGEQYVKGLAGSSAVKETLSSGQTVVRGVYDSGEKLVKDAVGSDVVKNTLSTGGSVLKEAISNGEDIVNAVLKEGQQKINGE
ncbi:hypothetical protein DL546_006242 [Coniochaeta pulveracea]|uniref:Mitochondrial carrier protein n=1 Tax=Coniochaeta pulveracea TaxID=177199 RepID=A0A420YBC0_9PEZI|nr:hypothetical protein DL546_006242 [Coniochaeta pulveracea]